MLDVQKKTFPIAINNCTILLLCQRIFLYLNSLAPSAWYECKAFFSLCLKLLSVFVRIGACACSLFYLVFFIRVCFPHVMNVLNSRSTQKKNKQVKTTFPIYSYIFNWIYILLYVDFSLKSKSTICFAIYTFNRPNFYANPNLEWKFD